MDNVARGYIARAQFRWHAGRLTFSPSANGAINSLALQADGKIIVGGGFTSIAGQARPYIARLNANGSIDPTFFPSVNSGLLSVGLEADGRVLVAEASATWTGSRAPAWHASPPQRRARNI